MKKLLAIFLSLTLLAVTVLTTGAFTVTATATTDTWMLFDAKELEYYNESSKSWQIGDSAGKGLMTMNTYGMSCYAHAGYATIFKLEVSESGTLVFDSTGSAGCKNTGYQWVKGSFEFAILDKNGKVIYPTDGNPKELLLLEDNGTYTGEQLPINLTVDVTAGDEFYFYHGNTSGTQANFQTKLKVSLNGNVINDTTYGDLCPVDRNEFGGTQGIGGWYYMYANTSDVEKVHADPNSVTDFGGDKYVATYTAQPMVKIEEGPYAGYWGSETTSDGTLVQGSSAYINTGDSVIVRFTAPEDGDFSSAFFGAGLYTLRDNPYFKHWWTTGDGEGVDFFIVNQDGELVEPAYDGPTELRTPLGEGSSLNVGYFSHPYMKKGDYVDIVIVGVNNPDRYPVSFGGDFSFNGVRYDAGGRMFLMNNEEQGHNNIQMFYATDVKVEKASTDAWLEYVRLEKAFTSAPATVEAWVNIPAEVPDYRVGTLISDYENDATDGFTVSVENYGQPRVQYGNGTVDWTVESVDLRTGEWQHVAFTVDAANNTVFFYLDGELKASATVEGITAAASDRPAVIGNDLMYAPATAFSGQVKNLAVFSDVRSETEIEADMNKVDTAADGLLGYYPLNGVYTDKSANANNGSVTTINTGYYDGELEAAEDDEFTIVHMGDQQMISSGFPYVMPSITQWIVDNQEKLNIKAVVNVGDYVNQAETATQWQEAVEATKLMTDVNIPFLFAPGNHEYPASGSTVRDEQYIKENFPLKNYFNQGAVEDNNVTTLLYAYPSTEKLADASALTDDMNIANAVYHINLGGQDYFFFMLEYQPRKTVIDNWAKEVMEKLEADENYTNAKTIVVTHSYIDPAGEIGYGDSPSFKTDIAKGVEHYSTGEMYDEFIGQYESISMVLCGHVASGIATSTQYGVNGNKITSIMGDFSYDGNGGEGVLMLYRFKADGTIKVETYSSLREQFYREQYQFDLELEAEEINQYWLDFDEKEMPFQSEDKIMWFESDSTASRFAHTQYRTYVEAGGRPSIRTFVAPRDGTFRAETIWGLTGLTVKLGSSVKFAVTDDNGKVLWPADGKPATLEAPTVEGETTVEHPHAINLSTPVKAGDKIHFVFYSTDGNWAQVEDAVMVSMDSYAGENQYSPGGKLLNRLEETPTSKDTNFPQGPVWYFNYADSISELTYNPNDPTEGVKLNYELNYGVRGEGGSINVMHNGEVVSAGKLDMNKGGNAIAYAITYPGYRIKNYYVNGVAVGRHSPYNLMNITEDTLLEIEYEKIVVEGDANSDGVADILDLVLMNAGEDIDKTVCDFVDPNNENIINIEDLFALRKRLLK